MIRKFPFQALGNSEISQFMHSAHAIFDQYGIDRKHLQPLYLEMAIHVKALEFAISVEKNNEKILEKNVMDGYRDRLHSRLFNHVKSILYDECDPQFDDAQAVMRVLKDAGNPAQMSENAQSVMLSMLGKRLSLYGAQLESIGAAAIVASLMEANREFIRLENECRQFAAVHKIIAIPSATTIRKELSRVYRSIADAINGYARTPLKMEEYREMVAKMNVLTARYDELLALRKASTESKIVGEMVA